MAAAAATTTTKAGSAAWLVSCANARKPRGTTEKDFLSKLVFLHVEGKGLSTLVGVELGLCSSLRVLFAGDNMLRSFDGAGAAGSGVGGLTELYVQNNSIAVLNMQAMAALPHLEKLVLDGNAISDIDPAVFLSTPRLRELSLCHQRGVTELRFGGGGNDADASSPTKKPAKPALHMLEELRVSSNNMKHVPAALMPRLSRLDLANSAFENLEALVSELASNCPNLRKLTVSGSPVAANRMLRESLTLALQSLEELDGKPVTKDQREFLTRIRKK